MSTIQTKGIYKTCQNFIERGDDISNNTINNKIFKDYYQYLASLENKNNTINLKLMHIARLEKFLTSNDKNFRSFNKENIINYIDECSKLNWSLLYQDDNKFQVKLFLNWMYDNDLSKISGNMILPKIIWHHNTTIRTGFMSSF